MRHWPTVTCTYRSSWRWTVPACSLLLCSLGSLVSACNDSDPTAAADASETGTDTSATDTNDASSAGSTSSDTADDASASGQGTDDSTASDSDSQGEGPGPIIFDVGTIPDAGDIPGGCTGMGGDGDGEPAFSYLWAANSSEGTISKIDTQTVTEVGRFIVRPDSAGSPSRTSVSLSGHVAVANREGGITKIYATEELCQDTNGTPGIQTSTDATALPWGQDECLAWYTPFTYESQRPVAWVQGEWNAAACQWENERLWTSGRAGTGLDVILLDGDDGTVIDQVQIAGLQQDFYGIYGGAVDGEGNFWGSQLGSSGRLVRVSIDDLSYEVFDTPSDGSWYGMTVDSDGYVWLCSNTAARFDYPNNAWQTASVGGYTGCMADAGEDGLLWMSSFNGLVGVNRQTLAVEQMWPTPGAYGVSIDFYGYVWTVAFYGGAHRVDPDTGDVQSYDGLVGAYTYSDMTGFALTHAGGGAPQG